VKTQPAVERTSKKTGPQTIEGQIQQLREKRAEELAAFLKEVAQNPPSEESKIAEPVATLPLSMQGNGPSILSANRVATHPSAIGVPSTIPQVVRPHVVPREESQEQAPIIVQRGGPPMSGANNSDARLPSEIELNRGGVNQTIAVPPPNNPIEANRKKRKYEYEETKLEF